MKSVFSEISPRSSSPPRIAANTKVPVIHAKSPCSENFGMQNNEPTKITIHGLKAQKSKMKPRPDKSPGPCRRLETSRKRVAMPEQPKRAVKMRGSQREIAHLDCLFRYTTTSN